MMEESETIDFTALERELQAALAADEKYKRENDAKFRAIHQKVASYEEFRDIVLASHLKPLERRDKLGGKRSQPWNSVATQVKHQEDTDTEIVEDSTCLPQTAANFYRDWRRKGENGAKKYSFLLEIGGERLGRIFSTEIEFGLLGEFLLTLSENFCSEDQAEVLQILHSLARTGRFGLNVDFLSTSEKQSCVKLFQRLQSTDCRYSTRNNGCTNMANTAATTPQHEKDEKQSAEDFLTWSDVTDSTLKDLLQLYRVL